jgi:hypothetical protein
MDVLSSSIRRPFEVVMKLLRVSQTTFWWVSTLGGWMMMICVASMDKKRNRSRTAHRDNQSAVHQAYWHPLSRMLRLLQDTLGNLCRPQSFWIPMISTMLAVLYTFRAMEDY